MPPKPIPKWRKRWIKKNKGNPLFAKSEAARNYDRERRRKYVKVQKAIKDAKF